ncbi:MAG: caspase family protein [Pseudomonadota bacterium]
MYGLVRNFVVLNGDERSGQDQTWVSFGTRQSGRENEIDNYEVLDDEINAWLATVYAKTDQVIFVSDSCHSATVARGNAPVSRGLEPDERSHLLGRMAYTQLDEYHGIHIGAARDKEFAAETAGDDGKYYGLFTWHWAKALQQAQVGETWNQVFKRAQTPVVGKRGEAQRPQLEGERHRQVFGGRLTPPVASVAVSSVKGEKIKMNVALRSYFVSSRV